MKWLLIVMMVVLSACSPVHESEDSKTKYPDVPTMQSAEDASKSDFTEESFK